MRLLFVFLTLVQWSVYTLGGVVFIIPEQETEDTGCVATSSCSSDTPTCSSDTQNCSAATPDCSEQDDEGCCGSIICLTICCPLQTGPVQEGLQTPHGIDLLASKN